VATIECLIFDGYTHGQILLPTPTQTGLVSLVKLNEKAGAKMLSAQEK
jgi:hypothetical protein